MENNKEKSIDVLNSLLEINNDRIEGYKHAADETDESTLKSLFSELAETSKKCKQELSSEIKKMGGTPKEGTATSGKIYRVWMDVKAALTNKNRKAILSSCETGEDVAVKAYEDALDQAEFVATEHQQLIKKQYTEIKAGHDKVKNLRDAFVKV
ncbi:MAG: ferritin-like domain-containing protein [Bacteroidia bacterium]